MSLAWSAYRAITWSLGALAPIGGGLAPAAERALWPERLGRAAETGGVEAWIHAASLGESTGVPPLAAELLRVRPGARLKMTAMTSGGRERLARLGHPTALAPLDAPQTVGRFLASVRPERIFLLETELWPHWLLSARDAGIPVAVLSARLSERSVARYRSLAPEFRGLVAALAGVACQSEVDRTRWLAIGAPEERTAVTGNLKWDGLPEPAPDLSRRRGELGLDPERPVLVLGSLRPGEVSMLGDAWRGLQPSLRAPWQVVAVPRHPTAAAELLDEAKRAGVAIVREGTAPEGAWRWDERLGVLASYYAVADVAFVGGSLVSLGGHNPLEPAATGAAVVMGPHFESQREAVELLKAADAIEIADGSRIGPSLARLLGDRGECDRRGRAARSAVEKERGAARRTVQQLVRWKLWPAA